MVTSITASPPCFVHLILSENNHNTVNRAVFERFLELKSSSTIVFYEGKKIRSWEILGAHSIEEDPIDNPLSLQGCIQALYLNFILQQVYLELDTKKEFVYKLLSELLLTCFQSPGLKNKLTTLASTFNPADYGYPTHLEDVDVTLYPQLNQLLSHLELLYSLPSGPKAHVLFFSFIVHFIENSQLRSLFFSFIKHLNFVVGSAVILSHQEIIDAEKEKNSEYSPELTKQHITEVLFNKNRETWSYINIELRTLAWVRKVSSIVSKISSPIFLISSIGKSHLDVYIRELKSVIGEHMCHSIEITTFKTPEAIERSLSLLSSSEEKKDNGK